MAQPTTEQFLRNLEGWGFRFVITPKGLAIDAPGPACWHLSDREKTFAREHADALLAILKRWLSAGRPCVTKADE